MRRGITHGPIALILLPVLLWALMIGFDRWQAWRGKRAAGRLPVHKGWLLALPYIGCLIPPALHWLNNSGLRLLDPINPRSFYGESIIIIDMWLWLALGVPVRRRSEARSVVNQRSGR